MAPQDIGEIPAQIREQVVTALPALPYALRRWAERHLVQPRRIVLRVPSESSEQATFWLVTDHTGDDDAPCRVVFDGTAFGLAVTLPSGVTWYLGRAGSFVDAVERL